MGILAQIVLLALGIDFLFIADGDVEENATLLLWSLVGTLYLGSTILWLNIELRVRAVDHQVLQRFIRSRVMRWLSTIMTFSASVVGLSAAITLILVRGDPDHLALFELVAVWAMLVSWALFHWGYARVYHSLFFRASGEDPLVFPRTTTPRVVDFVYFAFTNGTSFAPSDVMVTTTRMRWTVLWHTTMSFFFNALIIVLTMNTISGGLAGL